MIISTASRIIWLTLTLFHNKAQQTRTQTTISQKTIKATKEKSTQTSYPMVKNLKLFSSKIRNKLVYLF
jgi:hypothetical protein